MKPRSCERDYLAFYWWPGKWCNLYNGPWYHQFIILCHRVPCPRCMGRQAVFFDTTSSIKMCYVYNGYVLAATTVVEIFPNSLKNVDSSSCDSRVKFSSRRTIVKLHAVIIADDTDWLSSLTKQRDWLGWLGYSCGMWYVWNGRNISNK